MLFFEFFFPGFSSVLQKAPLGWITPVASKAHRGYCCYVALPPEKCPPGSPNRFPTTKVEKNNEETRCRFPSCFIEEFEEGGLLLQKYRHISSTFLFSNRNSVSHLEVLLLLGPHSPVRNAYWPSNWIPSTKVEKNYEETRCCFPRRFFQKS